MFDLDMLIKKEKLKELLKIEGMNAIDLYHVWSEKYGFSVTYKTFNKLLNNKIVWKMSYGMAIVELFSTDVETLFIWKD